MEAIIIYLAINLILLPLNFIKYKNITDRIVKWMDSWSKAMYWLSAILLAPTLIVYQFLNFLVWNFDCQTNRDIERMQKENKCVKKYTCTLCGRNNFDRPSPHKCIGGFRKRGLKWTLKN